MATYNCSFLCKTAAALLVLTALSNTGYAAEGQARESANARAKGVFDYWTPQRIADAVPRDLAIDRQGKGYLRSKDGSLTPYGQSGANRLSAGKQTPNKRPSGDSSEDVTDPVIANMTPTEGDEVTSEVVFSATVTDTSGIRSVVFVITYPDGVTTQSFNPSFDGNDSWKTSITGFGDENWSWKVIAKDGATKGGNTATSPDVSFTVNTGAVTTPPTQDTGNAIVNSPWLIAGDVQNAAGRIYFEMPGNSKRKGLWSAYVCSGTVVTDGTSGRSIIITAAHCVYDDVNKAFARNVLFIPNQSATRGTGTDSDCSNDPIGCWVPSFGVVDINWTTLVFPINVKWDYAYYVVEDSGAHEAGFSTDILSDRLDVAAGSLPISFAPPGFNITHALGYSYSDDPKFMYCSEDLAQLTGSDGSNRPNWWLGSCGLSGGSSGGPWIQPIVVEDGEEAVPEPIISVNSWGYTGSPGMAGPILSGSSAECLFYEAKTKLFDEENVRDGDAGIIGCR